MRIDSLARLVGAADSSDFREVAFLCLAKRGYEPSLTDGPHDGGANFFVYVVPPHTAKFAVQISTERDWQKKLRDDAAKARTHLGVENLLFLSTRVISPTTFQEVADDLLRTLGIQVQKMDAKDLASLAERRGFTRDLLHKLGIDIPAAAPKRFQPPDLRQNVAYACAFFGTDALEFRKSVIENAVLTIVFENGGAAERDLVLDRAALSLGLASNQRAQVTAAIDRMRQDGALLGKNGVVELSATAQDNWASVQALHARERDALRAQVDDLLATHVKTARRRADAVDVVLADLGALWLAQGRTASAALAAAESDLADRDSLRQRLRHLNATLDSLGIVDRKQREKLLYDLAALAAESSFGRALGTGEVFIHLVGLQTPHVFQAFGGEKELRVVLDTSVAMPLLCSLLYDAAEQDFFIAARHAYQQLVAHEVTMILPRDYLEEVASHLLDAHLLYSDIVDLDPDLRSSENAFVAHYVALRAAGNGAIASYAVYLAGFGLTDAVARGDFQVARDLLMGKLQAHFRRYGIETRALAASPSSARKAQEALLFAMRERGRDLARDDLERPQTLVEHDARTLGWLFDQAADPGVVDVICTWDKLHPYVQSREEASWDVLDPVALGDVLSLAAPGEDDVKIVSPLVTALAISADVERRGAAVWDALAAIEKGNLQDAALLATAREFKQAWVEETAKDRRARNLQEIWGKWKAKYLPQPKVKKPGRKQ